MAGKRLKRTTYRNPDPPNNVRPGAATRGEVGFDAENYHQPLSQIHGTLRGAGIASGMSVIANENSPGLLVTPGVAIDSLGRIISLAEGGRAEIGPAADAPGATPQLGPVTAEGVRLLTTGLTGDKTLVIRPWETFDRGAFKDNGAHVMEHTPWLQFIDGALPPADSRVPLGIVRFDVGANAGKVKRVLPVRGALASVNGGIDFRGVRKFGVTAEDGLVARIEGFAQQFLDDPIPHGSGIVITIPTPSNKHELRLHAGDVSLLFSYKNNVSNPALCRIEQNGDIVILSNLFQVTELQAFSLRVRELQVDGKATFSGGKVGFVVDQFRNATDGALERGDLVILGEHPPRTNAALEIPVPDVDRAMNAYDERLCGVVSAGAAPGEQGQMVTLGCYLYCKVDADVAPIKAGDLLTSSDTPGHAQKVTDKVSAIGAILGKALAPMASGKGMIPVLVLMQ